MDEKRILELNAEPWRLRKMSVKELLDTAALAKSIYFESSESIQFEITILADKCESLAVDITANPEKYI